MHLDRRVELVDEFGATIDCRDGRRVPAALTSVLPLWFALLKMLSSIGLVTGNPTLAIGTWNVDVATLLNVLAIAILLYIPFTARTAAPQQSGSSRQQDGALPPPACTGISLLEDSSTNRPHRRRVVIFAATVRGPPRFRGR